jgi:hypothetical protein
MMMMMPMPIPMGMMQRIPRLGRARHDRLEARRERAVGGSGSVIAGGLQLGRADARLVEEVGEVADARAARVGVARDGARVMVLVMGWGGLGGALLLVARKGGGLGVAPAAG